MSTAVIMFLVVTFIIWLTGFIPEILNECIGAADFKIVFLHLICQMLEMFWKFCGDFLEVVVSFRSDLLIQNFGGFIIVVIWPIGGNTAGLLNGIFDIQMDAVVICINAAIILKGLDKKCIYLLSIENSLAPVE